MKNNKPDAELLWKRLEDDLVLRLGLNLTERVVYAHLLRHSRLEGKRQLRFSIIWLARSAGLSNRPARHAVRGQCFYCLRRFVAGGRVLDHVVPRARGGSNSYRNLVSCCVECNTRKGETAAEDFLRTLFRLRRLTSAELDARLRALDALAARELRPILAPPAVVIRKQRES